MVKLRAFTAHARRLRELEAECAVAQPPRKGRADWLAIVRIAEWDEIRNLMGSAACVEVIDSVASLLQRTIPAGDRILDAHSGEITLVVHRRSETELGQLFDSASRTIVNHHFTAAGEPVRVTPAIGFTAFGGTVTSRTGLRCAHMALEHSLAHLDLRPTAFSNILNAGPNPWQAWILRVGVGRGIRFAMQLLAAIMVAIVLPFVIYMELPDALAMQLSKTMFVATIIVLVLTSTLINIEGILALRRGDAPEEPEQPYPPATAIVAAYLPNEAATIEGTIECLLAADYPAPLQVILAYNTPHDLPIEQTLQEIARRNPNFVPLRVRGSTSKAQNINAALSLVSGEFTGIFDADHRPERDSFRRAWAWLSDRADVVQGHCVIRNGSTNWLTRLLAVEFEQIYASAHPGGARLRGFAIFGGSNGYWRTRVLRSVRMRCAMMTEDIDSSMRAIAAGYRIVCDPGLISTELAPATLRALAHQRLRWAQGWCQVTLRHSWLMLKSPHLNLNQKIGVCHMLPWRDMFPWMSLQIIPILAFWIVRAGQSKTSIGRFQSSSRRPCTCYLPAPCRRSSPTSMQRRRSVVIRAGSRCTSSSRPFIRSS
ncbi:MAG: glycosyltransferase family 2 protein [Gemmatimonadota bacterium]|nr:glycosyltransferase family 2 protein [Gemmatimonadota bacterium]